MLASCATEVRGQLGQPVSLSTTWVTGLVRNSQVPTFIFIVFSYPKRLSLILIMSVTTTEIPTNTDIERLKVVDASERFLGSCYVVTFKGSVYYNSDLL